MTDASVHALLLSNLAAVLARIAHCDNEVGALTLKRLVLARFPEADITIVPLRGLCCFYGERGCVMLGFED